MNFAARIAELEGQLAEAQAGQAAAQAQAQTNFADLTAARAQVTTLTAERDAAVAQATALTAERDGARTELQAAIDGRPAAIEAEVVRRLAAAGTDPLRRDPTSLAGDSMSRAEFAQLPAHRQAEFCRKGGKITD